MPIVDALVNCPVFDSFRVQQVSGIFDLPPQKQMSESFHVDIPSTGEPWQIGVVVGPSGSGKSTVAKQAFGDDLYATQHWPGDKAIIDVFSHRHSIQTITGTLTSVGLSSPPAWLKPYHVLSNGEKFRCDLARALLDGGDTIVFDEFTSVVDRTVAKIGSAAIAKTLRRGPCDKRFVAVTCHYDVVPWLEPDWVVDMASQTLARGRLRRPEIAMHIRRINRHHWQAFKRHHYLASDLNPSSQCFGGFIDNTLAAFCAILFFPHPHTPCWREHRLVCLPDFQGIGIGCKMSEFIASVFRATGKRFRSISSHPALIRHRHRSPLWKMIRKPSFARQSALKGLRKSSSASRLTASFEYIGPARHDDARRLQVI